MSAEPAVITGGSGFIGSHLTALLIKNGQSVRILDIRPPHGNLPDGVEFIQGSILDREVLSKALNRAGTLYHMAANAHLWAPDKTIFERVNAEGTRRVLAEAAGQKIRKIVVTSTEVILRGWNSVDPSPLNEMLPLPKLDEMAGAYDRSKLRAEFITRKAAGEGLPVITTYPTVPVGAGDWQMTAPTRMIRDFITGKIPAYLDCQLNLIAVEDVAMAHYLAAENARPGDRFIVAGDDLRLEQILTMLEEISSTPMPRRKVPYRFAAAAGHISELISDKITGKAPAAPLAGVRFAKRAWPIDGGRARRELGLKLTPVQKALKASVNWLQEYENCGR